jgi:drug/metabolite transporter (DMT)-like permease
VVFWASAFPAIKIGLEGLEPAHLTLARHLVASLTFVPFLLAFRARRWPAWRDAPAFLGLGVVGISTYHLALNFGEVHVSAGASSLIIATAPALTALVAWWLTGDRLPALGWWGTAVALGGVALIVLGDGAVGRIHPAAGLVLLSAVATAFFAVLQRPYLRATGRSRSRPTSPGAARCRCWSSSPACRRRWRRPAAGRCSRRCTWASSPRRSPTPCSRSRCSGRRRRSSRRSST